MTLTENKSDSELIEDTLSFTFTGELCLSILEKNIISDEL